MLRKRHHLRSELRSRIAGKPCVLSRNGRRRRFRVITSGHHYVDSREHPLFLIVKVERIHVRHVVVLVKTHYRAIRTCSAAGRHICAHYTGIRIRRTYYGKRAVRRYRVKVERSTYSFHNIAEARKLIHKRVSSDTRFISSVSYYKNKVVLVICTRRYDLVDHGYHCGNRRRARIACAAAVRVIMRHKQYRIAVFAY